MDIFGQKKKTYADPKHCWIGSTCLVSEHLEVNEKVKSIVEAAGQSRPSLTLTLLHVPFP